MDEKRIPNWNDLACLIDRMTIEAVKEAQFEHQGKREKAKFQREHMKPALQKEFVEMMEELTREGYQSVNEIRTFD